MQANKEYGTTVELNGDIIAFLIGEQPEIVHGQILKMCAPDPKSRTKDEEGKKLIQLSEYTYRVVNGDHYRAIRNEQDRRDYQRRKQAEYREERKSLADMTPEERAEYNRLKAAARRKRKKQLRQGAYVAGATEAIAEGFSEDRERWETQCAQADAEPQGAA